MYTVTTATVSNTINHIIANDKPEKVRRHMRTPQRSLEERPIPKLFHVGDGLPSSTLIQRTWIIWVIRPVPVDEVKSKLFLVPSESSRHIFDIGRDSKSRFRTMFFRRVFLTSNPEAALYWYYPNLFC